MKQNRYGIALAVKEHLHGGRPITRLEALVLYGISNLTDIISGLRKEGWTIESRSVPFAAAVKRVNEFAVLKPPENLPIREIQLTEYWMNK
jgi:hypothetical protein